MINIVKYNIINKMDKILAEISIGELVDKITILEIKKEKIVDKNKLNEIEKELISLNATMKKYIPDQKKINSFKNDLKNVNLKLWNIEDEIRIFENEAGPEQLSSQLGK